MHLLVQQGGHGSLKHPPQRVLHDEVLPPCFDHEFCISTSYLAIYIINIQLFFAI